MRQWYVVKLCVSKAYEDILVYATDEEDAKTLAGIQMRCGGKKRGKIVDVHKEGEKSKLEEEAEKTLVFKIS